MDADEKAIETPVVAMSAVCGMIYPTPEPKPQEEPEEDAEE